MHTHTFIKYREQDSMSELVGSNYRILLMMSRFCIGLGFGEKTIGEVCRQSGVDTPTFLAVANMLSQEESAAAPHKEVSVASLLLYLHRSHDYFLEFRLPRIRTQLAEVVGSGDKLSRAILGYFDEYAAQVAGHMKYEEATVFPYVQGLLHGRKDPVYNIGIFRKRHDDQIEARLSEFKNIFLKYYTVQSTNEINGILFDIFDCEADLEFHTAVEDNLFVPAVIELEQTL